MIKVLILYYNVIGKIWNQAQFVKGPLYMSRILVCLFNFKINIIYLFFKYYSFSLNGIKYELNILNRRVSEQVIISSVNYIYL